MNVNHELICCTVGSHTFAFRSVDVRHAARVEHMRAETAPDGRAGTLTVSGRAIPVFELGGALGATRLAPNAPQHIAVTGHADEMVGWLVDRIARTTVADPTCIASLPAIVGTPADTWFDALVNLGDKTVLRLAPRHLNPLSPTASGVANSTPPVSVAMRTATATAETSPLVVLFSSEALPESGVKRCALSARQIEAVSQPLPLTAVPGSARFVIGVSWWRDAAVPLIDFRDRDAHATSADRRWLIVRCGGRLGPTLVAFPIDSDVLVRLPAAADERVDGASCPGFAAGLFHVGSETVALLDLDRLLLEPSVNHP